MVRLLSIEAIRDKFDDLGNTGRTTNEDNFMDGGFVDLGVMKHLLNGLQCTMEKIITQRIKMGMVSEM
jgi:hypothetical protein